MQRAFVARRTVLGLLAGGIRHPDDTTVGTFTAFKFGATGGDKIDYVLDQPGTEVLAADIVRTSRNDRHPSDHFPVVARVRLAQ